MSAIEQIKTLEDAYAALGLTQSEEIPFASPKNDRQEAANSFVNATVLVEALNEKKRPDYDENTRKYEVWWNMRSEAAGGPGFSYADYNCARSHSFVGARLVFHDWETARYAATQFPEVFKPFMTFPEK